MAVCLLDESLLQDEEKNYIKVENKVLVVKLKTTSPVQTHVTLIAFDCSHFIIFGCSFSN